MLIHILKYRCDVCGHDEKITRQDDYPVKCAAHDQGVVPKIINASKLEMAEILQRLRKGNIVSAIMRLIKIRREKR